MRYGKLLRAGQIDVNAAIINYELGQYDQAKAAARVTDDYVHDNPWQAIGVAAAVGFVVGLMMNRR